MSVSPARIGGQGGVVAGLLVAAVAEVLAVDDDLQVEQLGNGDGVVAGEVVDQDHVVDHTRRDVAVGADQRPGGVVGGHDHDDLRLGRVSGHRGPT